MPADASLLTLQRRLLAALREPIVGDSRSRSELPPRTGEPSAAFIGTATDLLTPSRSLRPTERLELYHRQYWYRLLDSLAEDFPGLRALLGDECFCSLLEAYLQATPARTFTLLHLGAGLVDFIGEHPGLVPSPRVATDMARLEYALCLAFEAAEHPPVDAHALATQSLALQPHVHLLGLRTPVDTLWRQREQPRRPHPPVHPLGRPPRDRFVVVFRHAFVLDVERLPGLAFTILTGIAGTGSLVGAMDRASRVKPRRRDLDRVQRWFATWVARGWFCRASSGPTPNERNTP
jgi:hypothetical protein